MSVDNQPRATFGRRGREVPAPPRPIEPVATDVRPGRPIFSLAALTALLLVAAGFLIWTLTEVGKINSAEAQAELQVIAIVNQPVTPLPRAGPVQFFSPGWFHDGAATPDFDTVDIRTTQQFPYNEYGYVSSDVTPNEMFLGSELEFNPMTKYFYADRSLPKKRLTEAEMEKINGLYRVIGKAQHDAFARWLIAGALAIATICLFLALLPLIRRASEVPAD